LFQHGNADEVWTMNHAAIAYPDMLGNPDRLYEIHKPEQIISPTIAEQYVEYLCSPHDYPIVMLEKYPGVPAARAYNFDLVYKEIFSTLLRGDPPIAPHSNIYLTSTAAMMLAEALVEGYNPIEIYGVEVGGNDINAGSNTEYIYQKAGTEFMIGVAAGMKRTVTVIENSALVHARIYGLEDGQMISRQTLEAYRHAYTTERAKLLAELNRASAKYTEAKDGGMTEKDLEPYIIAVENNKALLYNHDGALQVTEKLIGDCDLQTTNKELINRIVNG